MGEEPSFPVDCAPGDRDALRDAFAEACHAEVARNYQALVADLAEEGVVDEEAEQEEE